jgi:FlaA1/EpsC-like NDP-sugar epimerase
MRDDGDVSPTGASRYERCREVPTGPALHVRDLPPEMVVRFRRPIVLGLHLLLIPAGFWLAFFVRFDFSIPPEHRAALLATLPILLVARLGSFAVFGLFHGWWRHAGMRDLMDLARAVTISSAVLMGALFFLQNLQGLPRSILVLDWAIAILLFGGLRFGVRAFREDHLLPRKLRQGKRTLVVGAGSGAERLLRQFQRSAEIGHYHPVGLVDDDPSKTGMRIHGVPVLGTTRDLPAMAARTRAERLVIAIPSAQREEMRAIVDACLATGLEFKIIPSLGELLDGRARMNELRDVQIEDLLGRDAVDLSMEGPRNDLYERSVLVTGGAGSIGSELARQVARFEPRILILLDQAESPLYFTHLELAKANPSLQIIPVVADVTDQARLESIFSKYRPEYVFHAAAYKHVPLMEQNTVEAVRNNVLGTLNVGRCAARYQAEKFVLISTDKAVHPSSVMGATKRVAEQVVLGWPELRESETDFRAVRFGNVLGSEGSVIPLFKRQLAAGEPLTVTHRDVTRYFMTIPEAVQLVLQAGALPEAARRILMLEMGRPVRIVELAEQLVRLSGLEPYVDVPIVFTGMRPGEKLHEELMSELEKTVPTGVAKVRIVEAGEPDVERLTTGLDRLAAAVAIGSQQDSLTAICDLVPESVSPLRERGSRAAQRVG